MERHISGRGGKAPVIVAAAITLTGFAALIPRCLGEFFCFCFQQLVQRFFYAASYEFPYCSLITSSFSVTIFSDMVCRLLSNVCAATSFYQRPTGRVYFFAVFNLRNLLYLIHPHRRKLIRRHHRTARKLPSPLPLVEAQVP